MPLRGRPRRDRCVLRLIAVDRIVHRRRGDFPVRHHRRQLRGDYPRILSRLQGAIGGPLSDTIHKGFLNDMDRLFAITTSWLSLYELRG